MHRIHHSRLAGDRDKNFAAYFPIWDVIFGTYRAPVNDQFPPSGVEGIKHDTVLSLSIHPFVMWGNRLRKAIRASSRVKVVIYANASIGTVVRAISCKRCSPLRFGHRASRG